MSIATRTGDDGTTGLMFGRRVPKEHPRVGAYGAVDELNAALGMVRAFSPKTNEANGPAEQVMAIQKMLVGLMGELATAAEDRERYLAKGYATLQPEHLAKLDELIALLEGSGEMTIEGWDTPGATPVSACWHVARTTCRRAERAVLALRAGGEEVPALTVQFLNRLSDLCWLYGRHADAKAGA